MVKINQVKISLHFKLYEIENQGGGGNVKF